jgi:hypothetical protein
MTTNASLRDLTTFSVMMVIWFGFQWTSAAQEAPIIDGVFSEWNTSHLMASDPAGDATGSFDLTDIHVRVYGTTIFMKLKIEEPLNLQNGPEDEGTLILKVGLPRKRQLEIDFRNRIALLRSPDAVSTIPWVDLRFEAMPTYAASEFECQIDLKTFGLRASDQIEISFEGSDELETAVVLSMNSLPFPPYESEIEIEKSPGRIRLASINTLNSGLSDQGRSPIFRSMLELANADIYCFNEEWDDAKFHSALPEVFPSHHTEPLNSCTNGGCAIVSESAVRPILMDIGRSVAAAVDLPSGTVVVVSVHFKCCGFAGSPEDERRISEAKALVGEIRKLKGGRFGADLAMAPVIIIGDYNLVGSRRPLELILEEGFDEYLLRSPVDGSVSTWRAINPKESFWPGRLDLVSFEKDGFKNLTGFILSAGYLSQLRPELDAGQPASDHAMLVVDWGPPSDVE